MENIHNSRTCLCCNQPVDEDDRTCRCCKQNIPKTITDREKSRHHLAEAEHLLTEAESNPDQNTRRATRAAYYANTHANIANGYIALAAEAHR